MSKLPALMQGLKAYTVIIIENALQFENDAGVILGKFCLFKCSRDRICSGLEQMGHKVCAKLLGDFYHAFNATGKADDAVEKGAVDFFKRYISVDLGLATLNEDEVLKSLQELLQGNDSDEVKSLFLKHGIYSIEEAGYSHIIEEISQVPQSEVLFFRGAPPAHSVDDFFSEIEIISEQAGSEFCLAIVDKKLGTGGADEEGRNFIIDHIIPRNEQPANKKIICCLYTSAPEELIPTKFKEYFIQEISKNSPEKLNYISKTLARAAYAQVFYLINLKYKESSDEALDLVLLNQQNIKYIIQESHLEGIPAYEAIKYWFHLAQQHIYEKKEIEDFDFTATLTSFFNQDHIEDHPRVADIGDDLKALNAYELFDLNVNQKFLPIAPGDIWKTKESYYILTGQLCDILLRQSENKRGAKIAEFLKAEVVEYRDSGKKYDVEVKDGKKVIWIENFYDEEAKNYKTLKIIVATANIYYGDLRVLDLAMFNKDGSCQIKQEGDLDNTIKQILPLNKDVYYKKLQALYPGITKLKEIEGVDLNTVMGPVDIALHDFRIESGHIVHEIKRVARLKGRYFDSLYNNYINNKSRIDLNLIDNASETAKTVQLSYKLYSETEYAAVNMRIWNKKGREYIKKEDLKAALNGKFNDLTTFYDSSLGIGPSKHYELTKVDEASYQLDMYVHIAATSQARFHNKQMFNYSHLFNGKPVNTKFRYLDNDEEGSFYDVDGNKVSFELGKLSRGILVEENMHEVKLEDGIVKFNKIDEKAD